MTEDDATARAQTLLAHGHKIPCPVCVRRLAADYLAVAREAQGAALDEAATHIEQAQAHNGESGMLTAVMNWLRKRAAALREGNDNASKSR